MGSAPKANGHYYLPNARTPTLILEHPSEEQKRRTWTLNYKEWGGPLTLEEYLEREPFLATIPLSRDGGMTHWILTDAAWAPTEEKQHNEPVLASCETIRKPVIVATPDSDVEVTVTDRIAHGIGSVFTYPEHRGNSYAGRMLNELAPTLKSWQITEAACSALWSDIGKDYYAKKGWAAFPSLHVEFSVAANQHVAQAQVPASSEASPIMYGNLERMCERDEQLLRLQVARTAFATQRTCVTFVPDKDTMRWHLYRDDFITTTLYKSFPLPRGRFSAASSWKGAVAGLAGRQVWAIWSRNYGGAVPGDPARDVDKNTLYILRLVAEPEASDKTEGRELGDDVVEAFVAVMRAALHEARIWSMGRIEMWNPSPTAKRLIERSGLWHRWVDRDTDSIPSMMWYGEEDVRDIEWVANEKYCWC
ncbi:hypothetical protein Hte_000578 [Hypoxylon texense]